jgi:hypothetical protein
MANHLTPTELAREAGMERRDVLAKCIELGIPIFNGRIDKTLFLTSLRQLADSENVTSDAHHYTLLDGDGNLIASFGNEGHARAEFDRILASEPEAEGQMALIAYDGTGHPVGALTRRRRVPSPA